MSILEAAAGGRRPSRRAGGLAVRAMTLLVALVPIGFVVLPTPAHASFPGQNGRIAALAWPDYDRGAVLTMRPDGSQVSPVLWSMSGQGRPAFSPDGSRIAVLGQTSTSSSKVFVIDADGSNPVQVTSGTGIDWYPAWSPDGTKIAFSHYEPGDDWRGITVINVDGTNPRQVTQGRDLAAAWSPDGSKLAFMRSIGGSEAIYVVDVATHNANQLFYVRDWFASQPDWSPDGSKIAFDFVASFSPPPTYGRIYMMDADGGNPHPLTDEPSAGGDSWPAWSPDGSMIAFTRGAKLFVMNADGTNPRPLTSGSPPIGVPSWTPLRLTRIHVSVSGPVAAEVPFTVTATATDGSGDTIPGYSGPASWSSLDGVLTPAAPHDFVNGVSRTLATVATAFAADRITVSSGSLTGQSNSFDVLAPTTIVLKLKTPITVGTPFTLTATAMDATQHQLSGFNAPATWSDLSGALSPTTPAAFVNGVSTTTATIVAPFRGDRIRVASGGVSGQSPLFNVFGPLASFSVRLQGAVGVSAPVAVGAAVAVPSGSQFQVKAVARDAVGNPLNSYNGAATWSSLDGALSPATPAAFVNGVSTTTATIAVPYRGDQITISSGGVTGQSGLFTVIGPLAAIRVRVATPVTHGAPFTVKATAADTLGTPLPNYNATASWSSLDGRLTPAAPSAFVNGVSTTTATIPNAFANDRITLTSGGITGKSGFFTVH